MPKAWSFFSPFYFFCVAINEHFPTRSLPCFFLGQKVLFGGVLGQKSMQSNFTAALRPSPHKQRDSPIEQVGLHPTWSSFTWAKFHMNPHHHPCPHAKWGFISLDPLSHPSTWRRLPSGHKRPRRGFTPQPKPRLCWDLVPMRHTTCICMWWLVESRTVLSLHGFGIARPDERSAGLGG